MLFRLRSSSVPGSSACSQAIGFTPRVALPPGAGRRAAARVVGGVVGLVGAVGYTWLMVAGLRTWWVDAVGTTALRLHVEPMTLAIGFVAGVVIAMLAVVWAARRLRAGRAGATAERRLERRRLALDAGAPRIASRSLAVLGVVGGVALLVGGAIGVALQPGRILRRRRRCCCSACLSAVAWLLRSGTRAARSPIDWSLASLGHPHRRAPPARSLLTVSPHRAGQLPARHRRRDATGAAEGSRREELRHRRLPADRAGRHPAAGRSQHARRPRASSACASRTRRSGRRRASRRCAAGPGRTPVASTSRARTARRSSACRPR